MIRGGRSRVAGRAGRRPAWTWVVAALLIVTAITVIWAAPAQAQDKSKDAWERALFDDRRPPGKHPGYAYRITYNVDSPLQKKDDCGWGWLGNPVFGLGGAAVSKAKCTEVNWGFIGDLFWGLLTESAFNVTRGVATVGIWFVERAYAFDIVEWLDGPAEALANRLSTRFIGAIKLQDFVLFLAVFYSGWQILRRRTRQALSELAASLLVASLGTMLVANPSWLLDTAVPYSVAMSGAMLELHSENEGNTTAATELTPGKYDQLVRPLTNELHDAMLGQPYDMVNWGEVLTKEQCVTARNTILKDNEKTYALASGNDDGSNTESITGNASNKARQQMRDAGCAWNADFNANATDTRFAMAAVSAIVTLIVTVMLGLIAIVVIGSQLVLAQMLVVAPLAVVFGTVPGTGRQLLARWFGVCLQALAAIVVMSFVLTLLLELTTTILVPPHDDPNGLNLSNRYFVLLIGVIILFRARKKFLSLVEEILERAAERLQAKVDAGAGGDLMNPGNMIRFGMGAAVGQTLVQQTSGALLGRWFGRRSRPGGGGGAGGALPGGGGGPLPPGGGPGGALPPGGGTPAGTGRNQRAGRYGRGAARPTTAAARRSMGFRRMLLQGARMVPGAGRVAGAAAATVGRGAGRAALGTPRGLGRVGAMAVRGTRIGVAGARATPRATASLVRRAPIALAQGTRAAAVGTARGAAVAGRAVNRGVDEAMFRTGMAGVRTLYGTENSARAVAAGARWTGREVGAGFRESMARPSPLAERLQNYAAGAEYQGRHGGRGRHRQGPRPPRGGSGT